MYYEPETKTQKIHILKPRYLEYIIHTYTYKQISTLVYITPSTYIEKS